MPKMNIADAAEYFGVSKEAIHNRIRRGSLSSVMEDGVKLVMVDKTNVSITKPQIRKTSIANDDRYYKLLEEQNAKLQDKIEKLEDETRGLREQKEQMLIQERIKIEQIYKDKDEQLKNILGTLSSQFMLNTPEIKVEPEHLEAEIEDAQEIQEVEHVKFNKLISLKKYLKLNKYSSKKHEKIKKRFKKIAPKDERVIIIDKKYYLNLNKYDYSDIF